MQLLGRRRLVLLCRLRDLLRAPPSFWEHPVLYRPFEKRTPMGRGGGIDASLEGLEYCLRFGGGCCATLCLRCNSLPHVKRNLLGPEHPKPPSPQIPKPQGVVAHVVAAVSTPPCRTPPTRMRLISVSPDLLSGCASDQDGHGVPATSLRANPGGARLGRTRRAWDAEMSRLLRRLGLPLDSIWRFTSAVRAGRLSICSLKQGECGSAPCFVLMHRKRRLLERSMSHTSHCTVRIRHESIAWR